MAAEARTVGRSDLSAVLIRPAGMLTLATDQPAEPELLQTALRYWVGNLIRVRSAWLQNAVTSGRNIKTVAAVMRPMISTETPRL